MIKFFKKYWAIIVLVVSWIPITFYNTKIYWMFVDDGWDVVFARTLFEKLSHLNIVGFVSQLFETGGRFRPVYWFYHTWVWLIGENSFQFQHFAHMIVIGVAILFIYLTLHELTKSKTISLLGSLFYFFVPLNTENIMRLGPQEPLIAMFFAVFFYLLVKTKKVFLPCLMIVLAVFTKETALALLPVFLFYYLYQKNNSAKKEASISLKFLITITASSVAMVLITFLRRSGYSTNYSFDVQMMVENLFIYFKELSIGTSMIFPIIPGIYLLRTLYKLIKKKKLFETKIDMFEFIFLGGFLCFLAIQLPWAYALTRYLMPAILLLTLFMFLEVHTIVQLIKKLKFVDKHKKVVVVLSLIAAFYTLSLWGLDVVLKERSSISTQEVFKKLAKLPENTILLMNMPEGEGTVELVDEMQIHMSEFWKRGDVKSDYLDLKNLPKDNYIVIDSSQFPKKYEKEELFKVFGKEYFSSEKSADRLVFTTPLELIKQSVKKLTRLVVNGEKFNSEGIYTYYHSSSDWYFYKK